MAGDIMDLRSTGCHAVDCRPFHFHVLAVDSFAGI